MINKYHLNQVASRKRIYTGAIALAMMAVLVPGYVIANRKPAIAQVERNVTPEEITENLNKLIGQPITVRSEVVRTIGTNAFKISDDQFFNGQEILVVNASGQPLPVLPNNDIKLQVTGVVRRFALADVEREFDLDLQPDLYVEYESQPAIVARSIALAPEPSEIAANPSLYYNKPIAVEAEIEEIMSPVAFKLDDEQLVGGQELLVLNRTPQATLRDGARVVVTGILRPFVLADIERDYDLTWDLDMQRTLEAEYRNKPVLVADGIFPSAVAE